MSFLHSFAYLDPSSGSLLFQSIIGATMGTVIFGRRIVADSVRKVKSALTSNNKSREEQAEE